MDCILYDDVARLIAGANTARELRLNCLNDLKDVVRNTKSNRGRAYESRHRLISEVVIDKCFF